MKRIVCGKIVKQYRVAGHLRKYIQVPIIGNNILVKENKCWNVEARKGRTYAESDEIKKRKNTILFPKRFQDKCLPRKRQSHKKEHLSTNTSWLLNNVRPSPR